VQAKESLIKESRMFENIVMDAIKASFNSPLWLRVRLKRLFDVPFRTLEIAGGAYAFYSTTRNIPW